MVAHHGSDLKIFRLLDKVTVPDGRMSRRKSLVVESDKMAIAQA
jgi:hypothetical protein